MILFEKSHHKLSTLVTECDSTNRRTLGLYFIDILTSEETFSSDSHTGKIGDINREISNLSKEMFEIKILVNENKESDDKNQASVNKKLNDIVEKKGNVNEQLNNLLYQLTNAEVAIEENNRNTLTQVTKLKKFQSQLSDDFRNVFLIQILNIFGMFKIFLSAANSSVCWRS